MKSIAELSQLVNAYRVHQIRSGKNHRFVDISIVETEGRFFVRQYKFNPNSWYGAFLKTPEGEIKCGDTVIEIEGKPPEDLDTVNPLVNRAFKKKYGIIYTIMKLFFDTKKHEASTLELIPQIGK